MIGLKTLVGGLCVATSMAQATPIPVTPTEQVRVFAICAGRFSALTEHQWLVDGPASEATEELRAAFADLLDAVTPAAVQAGMPDTLAISLRIEAKAAQRELLSLSLFAEDARDRARAAIAARAKLDMCRGLILQG